MTVDTLNGFYIWITEIIYETSERGTFSIPSAYHRCRQINFPLSVMSSNSPDIWPYLYGTILFQGIFLGIVLTITRKGNVIANRYLALIMFMFSLATAERVVASLGGYTLWPHLLFVSRPFWYLLPPLYYFYARSFAGNPIRLTAMQWLHALPVVAVLIHAIPFYAWPVEVKLSYINNPSLFYNHHDSVGRSLLYYFQSLAYLLLSVRTFRRAGRGLKLFSNEWLLILYSLLLIYFALHLIQTVYYYFSYEEFFSLRQWGLPIYAVLIYSFTYFAFVKPEKIFVPPWKLWEQKNGRLSLSEKLELIDRVKRLMDEEKPYLDCRLKYSDVAVRLGISVRNLSNVLNHAGHSFNDFINSYRVHEAKQQILSGKLSRETLLSVAFNSGFANKSSFNRIFKQHTGLTPTEFLESSQSIVM